MPSRPTFWIGYKTPIEFLLQADGAFLHLVNNFQDFFTIDNVPCRCNNKRVVAIVTSLSSDANK